MNLKNTYKNFILMIIIIFSIFILFTLFSSLKNRKMHSSISDYLKETEHIIKDINNITDVYNNSQNKTTSLKELKNILEQDLISLYETNPPTILEQYNLIIIKKINIAYEILPYSLNDNKNNSSHVKTLFSKLNLYENIRKTELVKVFEKTNMEYNIYSNGDIIYRWSN